MAKISKDDITYRAGTDSDVPEIVNLLRESLGEALLPKSEAFWNWKHVNNPFGESPLMVAVHDGSIIGVRAFMQWKWKGHHKTFHALRAVDTAVHPDYQGFGIFTKLTLGLIDTCKKDGFDLIFNTPNDKSRPGYLKMGWVAVGNLPIRLRFVIGLRGQTAIGSLLMPVSTAVDLFFDKTITVGAEVNFATTPISKEFLLWRYQEVPGQQYFGWTDEQRALLVIVRLKAKKWINEVRIVGIFRRDDADVKSSLTEFIQTIRKGGSSYLTVTPHSDRLINIALNGNLFLPAIGIGPVVTIRKISDTFDVGSFNKHWRPAMGDMELF